MVSSLIAPLGDLDAFVEAYEESLRVHGRAEISNFLPDSGHPLYSQVLRELVRVDLETSWTFGSGRRLHDYQQRFPELFHDAESMQEVAFEEYRLRLVHGEKVMPAEYGERFGVRIDDWPPPPQHLLVTSEDDEAQPPTLKLVSHESSGHDPLGDAAIAYAALRLGDSAHNRVTDMDMWLSSFSEEKAAGAEVFRDLHVADPRAACRMAQAAAGMPKAGTSILDFELLEELGRGTFGRVYLARQRDLFDRLVALKISADLGRESRSLSQLQHTHIMPIYSMHRAGAFQAVCMPFFGATTLADVLKELAGFETLPQSGTHLVSTLRAKHNAPGSSTASGIRKPAHMRDTRKPNHTLPVDELNHVHLRGSELVPAAQPTSSVLGMLRHMSYVNAIVWIATRLAEALEHAHERGILHRDIKPANVLLTDQGPMLLDFNLAEDTKQPSSAAAAMLGGTLPYMAPEHLEAFRGGKRPVDARSDLYALGVILYELLAGRAPYPNRKGAMGDVLPCMLDDRRKSPPAIRTWNPAVPPAVESIVFHLLETNPDSRYATAAQLREDLHRHERSKALKFAPNPSILERAVKYVRRNRWAVACSIAAVLVGAMAVFGIEQVNRRRALENERPRLVALDSYDQFRKKVQSTGVEFTLRDRGHPKNLQGGIDQAGSLLAQYGVLENPDWQSAAIVEALPQGEKKSLKRQIGLLLAQMTQASMAGLRNQTGWVRTAQLWNARAMDCLGEESPMLNRQKGLLAALEAGSPEKPTASSAKPDTSDEFMLLAGAEIANGEYRKALPHLDEAVRLDPRNFWAWWDKARCHQELAQLRPALESLTVCVALQPHESTVFLYRGMIHHELRDSAAAAKDFDQALAYQPGNVEALERRALARQALGKYNDAVEDFTQAIERGGPSRRVLLLRSRAKAWAKDAAGAREDELTAAKYDAVDERDWIATALAKSRDPKATTIVLEAALADYDRALALNPRSRTALNNKASVLSEKLNRQADAVAVLDKLLAFYPDDLEGHAGRGVVLARLGDRDNAVQEAAWCKKQELTPLARYQVACIYALTAAKNPADRTEALRWLASSLQHRFGLAHAEKDSDLVLLHNDVEFKRLIQSAKALQVD